MISRVSERYRSLSRAVRDAVEIDPERDHRNPRLPFLGNIEREPRQKQENAHERIGDQ